MSGFFGIFRPQGGPVDLEAFEQMKSAMNREGFDGMEIHVEDNIAMGHLMLRVSPESQYDKQPLKSSCGNYLLVGHFRLDYRDELGDKLGLTQAELEVTPDSQLAMLAYQKWKEKCVHHLEGDWAFALLEKDSKQLNLFKDKTGTSSCFYGEVGESFFYSSDPIAFNNNNKIGFEINLKQFYAFSIPQIDPYLGQTLDTRFCYLISGSKLTINSTLNVKFYINKFCNKINKIKYRYDIDYIYDMRSLLASAISSRIRTKYEIGLFLSGGLDSTTIGSFMSLVLESEHRRLNSFTSYPAFLNEIEEGKRKLADERENVKEFVRFHKNTNPLFLDFKECSISNLFHSEITESIFNPVVNKNKFWIHGILEKCQTSNIKRVFNAQLGNYTITWNAPFVHLGLLSNGDFKRMIIDLVGVKKNNNETFSKVFYENILNPIYQILQFRIKYHVKRFLKIRVKNNYLTDKFYTRFDEKNFHTSKINTEKIYSNSHLMRKSFLTKYLTLAGIRWYLNSCMHAIEVCDPTSDSRIVSYSLSIPEIMFNKAGIKKYFVKKLMKDFLPKEILFCNYTFQQSQDVLFRISEDEGFEPNLSYATNASKSYLDLISDQLLNLHIQQIRSGKYSAIRMNLRLFLNNLSLFWFLNSKKQ